MGDLRISATDFLRKGLTTIPEVIRNHGVFQNETVSSPCSMHPLKTEARLHFKSLLAQQKDSLFGRSAEIRGRIVAASFWAKAQTVAMFAPLSCEPDLVPLLDSSEKRFVFPKVLGSELQWFHVSHPESQLRFTPGSALRILEPTSEIRIPLEEIDLLLIPGLAFTPEGLRLGRGGGFYDRVLLRRGEDSLSVGVCFSFQMSTTLPVEPHDMAVDRVVSDAP